MARRCGNALHAWLREDGIMLAFSRAALLLLLLLSLAVNWSSCDIKIDVV
jgi:hypothetical protein